MPVTASSTKDTHSVKKILLGLAAILAVGAPLTLAATPAQAADDGQGNTFNVRESHVKVVGDRCAYIHYSVDGWSAGWDADYTMGSAFVTVHGAGIDEIEMYDWWDWYSDGLGQPQRGVASEQCLCQQERHHAHHPCRVRRVPRRLRLRRRLQHRDRGHGDPGLPARLADRDQPAQQPGGEGLQGRRSAWGHVRASVAGLTARDQRQGRREVRPSGNCPQGQVKVTVGTSPAYAALKARVS